MASARIAADADPDRATVVIHARAEVLTNEVLGNEVLATQVPATQVPASEVPPSAQGGCELEGGGVIHPQEAIRAACSGRIQRITEDQAGDVVRVEVMSREPSAWMLRQLKYRDRECLFPGCHSTRF